MGCSSSSPKLIFEQGKEIVTLYHDDYRFYLNYDKITRWGKDFHSGGVFEIINNERVLKIEDLVVKIDMEFTKLKLEGRKAMGDPITGIFYRKVNFSKNGYLLLE